MRLLEFQEIQFMAESQKTEYINKMMGPKLLDAAKQDRMYKDYATSEDVVERLALMDPSPNKVYLQWLANLYVRRDFRMEDVSRVHKALAEFDRRKAALKPEQRDLMKYKTLDSLEEVVGGEVHDITSNKELARQAKANAKRIVDTPNFKIIQPTSEEAACFYGAGTKWCTAARENNQFESYNNDGPLFIMIVGGEQSQRKFQMHVESESFMDERDKPVGKADVAMLSDIPEYTAFLSTLVKQHIVDYSAQKQKEKDAEYEDDMENGLGYKYWDQDEEGGYLNGNQEYDPSEDDEFRCDIYSWSAYPETLPGFKDFVVHFPELIVRATKNSKTGVDQYHRKIMLHGKPDVLAQYAANLGRRLPQEAEKIIAKSPGAAAEYATEVLKARWPEVEDKILDSAYGHKYIREVFKDRDAAFEQVLLDPSTKRADEKILSYCEGVEQRWPEGEKVLLANPGISGALYAWRVIKGRWPEFEQAMLANKTAENAGMAAVSYASNVLKGRWREMEPTITHKPYDAANYVVSVIKRRVPELEPKIAQNEWAKKLYEKHFKIEL